MKILVFGNSGQVSSEIKNSKSVIKLGKKKFNLLNLEKIKKVIKTINPKAVINTAAETNVDFIEKNYKKSFTINALAPIKIAEVCKELDIPFLHLSTDYVFDGESKKPYLPNDLTKPINKYGKSKLYAENGIKKLDGKYIILRISWVFSKKKNNFLYKIISKSKNEQFIKVVTDQMGSPTPAKEVARTCLMIIKKVLKNNTSYGTYHFVGKPYTNWYKFSKFIFKNYDKNIKIIPVETKNITNTAKRPKNSKLDCSSLRKTFNIDRPNWKLSVLEILKNIKKKDERD